MTSDRWEKLQAIFIAAIQREAGERAGFVHEECGGDGALEAEVESLLRHYDEGSGFLKGPALDKQAADATIEAAAGARIGHPSVIGRYRILGLVGEGGMGVVYEAEQEQPRRKVALKVIKPGLVSAELLRRFRQESEALARLQHPGIAQIYEAGEEDKGEGLQPFFAMEFIRGLPLVRYADENHLNLRERLELVAKVCDAVEHAHVRGLIHRDLKPGNILVDAAGQPKILDFGVAHATDGDVEATLQTDIGQLVGTLAYMSPEQVLGDPTALDARSDVYALGLILYQLLAGRLPYEISPKIPEAVRTIQEDDPTPLSSISRSYRGDVETMVAKALEKQKARRYKSAEELADDIRHYLRDEPISARPASAIYRLEKFTRRHKAIVSGVLAAFVVLVLGVIVSAGQAMRARRAEGAALTEAATAKAVSEFLQNDLLAQASAFNQAWRPDKPDPDLKVRTALDRAAARVGGKFDRQPEVEAAIEDTIGQTYGHLGLYPEGRKHMEHALALYRRVLGVENATTLGTMSRLGVLAQLQAKYPEAEGILNQTVEMQRRVLGPEHPQILRSMSSLAAVYYFEGKYPQAEKLCRETLELQRRLLGAEDSETLNSMNLLTNIYVREGKYPAAAAIGSQTLAVKRHVLGAEHPDTLNSMNSLAVLYMEQGKYAQAEGLQSQTLEIKRRVLGGEEPNTLAAMNNLANTYYVQGKYEQAERLYRETFEIKHRVLGAEHPDTLAAMSNLADACYQRGKYVEAEGLFSQAVEKSRQLVGADNPYTLTFLSDMAGMYQREGKYGKAEKAAAQVLTGQRHTLGAESPDTIDTATDLALAYDSEGKFAESERLAREAVEFDSKNRPDVWQRFRAEAVLGASLAGQKKYEEAETLLLRGYQGMIARKDQIAVPDQYHLELAGKAIVQLYLDWGKPEKAAEWRKAVTL